MEASKRARQLVHHRSEGGLHDERFELCLDTELSSWSFVSSWLSHCLPSCWREDDRVRSYTDMLEAFTIVYLTDDCIESKGLSICIWSELYKVPATRHVDFVFCVVRSIADIKVAPRTAVLLQIIRRRTLFAPPLPPHKSSRQHHHTLALLHLLPALILLPKT